MIPSGELTEGVGGANWRGSRRTVQLRPNRSSGPSPGLGCELGIGEQTQYVNRHPGCGGNGPSKPATGIKWAGETGGPALGESLTSQAPHLRSGADCDDA
jgi:hypothetical protein